MIYVRLLQYILMSAMLFMCGCMAQKQAEEQLDKVKSLAPCHPEAAVKILADMDTIGLSERQKVCRTLLHAYICIIHASPVELDAGDMKRCADLFNASVNEDAVKWLIVKAAMAGRQGDVVARIESLKDAEFLALQVNSEFDLAMIYQYLADVYRQGYNGTVSEYYAGKAVEILSRLGCPKQLREARMNIAGALAAKGDYVAMRDSLLSMKSEVMAAASDGYKVFFLDQLARAYDETGQSREAIELWHSIYDGKAISPNTLAHWARAYCRINDLDSAYTLIQSADSLAQSHTDKYLCLNVKYGILEKMGHTDELAAIDSLRTLASNDIFEDRKLEQSSLALNKKYDSATRQAWIALSEARTRTQVSVFIAILISVIAIAIYLYLRKRNQWLSAAHENDILRIQTLQSNMFDNSRRQEAMASRIAALFNTRFDMIDGLASSYFECKDTGREQKNIYAKVKESIASFCSEAATQDLENVVNGYKDNLMARFREDFPRLSKAQYKLALYLFCSFSLPSISIFNGSDLRNIYVYKSRLKSIISKSVAGGREEYLSYFT